MDLLQQMESLLDKANKAEAAATKAETNAAIAKDKVSELEKHLKEMGIDSWEEAVTKAEGLQKEAEEALAKAAAVLNGAVNE